MILTEQSGLFAIVTLYSLFVTGCRTIDYNPSVYDLAENRIPQFEVKGEVVLQNAQLSTAKQKSSASGSSWIYTYHEVTEGFNRQFYTEIEKRAVVISPKGKKTLKTFISELQCGMSSLNPWITRCTIKGWLETGDGRKVVIFAKHGASSVFYPMERSLDGIIAIAVEKSLKNDAILSYLRK